MIVPDIDKIQLDKNLELEVEGWVPITIEYTTKVFSGISWLYWKVSGTSHVFKIQNQLVIMNHKGDLKEHFELVLKTFRQDYKDWEQTNFSEDWMKKYQQMFHQLIK
jgi:hypothetical protein